MVGGANPAAANDGGSGNGGLSDLWRANSTALVPGLYGIVSLIGWLKTPTAPGVGDILLVSGVVLIALAVAVVVMKLPIGSRQDYFGGLGLLALSLFALWASRDLPGMRGFAFGPGTAPRMFAIMLGLHRRRGRGCRIFCEEHADSTFRRARAAVHSRLDLPVRVAASGRWGSSLRASFRSLFRPARRDEVRWVETVIWAAVLTLFCALLFPWGLNLPLPMWPTIDHPPRSEIALTG